MRRDRLYTITKRNKPILVHSFAIGGDTGGAAGSMASAAYNSNAAKWDRLASTAYGSKYGDAGYTLADYKNSKNALGISKENNPFSKGNIENTASAARRVLAESSVGDIVLDAFDPVRYLAGGRETAVGNSLSSAGNATLKAGLTSGEPYVMLAGAALKVGGGLANAAFGIKTDQEALKTANNAVNYYKNINSNASSFDDVNNLTAQGTFKNPYKGGWFSGGKARRKNKALKTKFQDTKSFAERSIDNNVSNLQSEQIGTGLANYAAYGGLLDTINNSNMGATEYGFMSDYLTMKDKQAQNKNNMIGYLGTNTPTLFALGGDMQTNGADFTTGLGYINAGNSHETNPYGGVQLGIAPDGAPNLVEENETVFNDYVFSNRLRPSKKVLRMFRMGGNLKATYADVSKRLEKEAKERPNDPISQASLKNMLAKLAEAQEEQKAEEEAKRAREAFEALSPEEQQMVLAQITQQQQAEQAAQEQEVSPEEQQMMQEQAMQQQAMQGQQEMPVDENGNPVEMQPQEVQMAACGGKLGHRFDYGGRERLMKDLGFNFASQLKQWALDNKVGYYVDKDKKKWMPYDLDSMDDGILAKILKDQTFIDAYTKNNKKMADAMGKRGYDLGIRQYDPMAHITLTNSMNNGNFKAWDGNDFKSGVLGWAGEKDANKKYSNQSNDIIWSQFLDNYMKANKFEKGQETEAIDHLLEKGNLDDFTKMMADTQAYKDTTKLLQDNEDLRRRYYYELSKLEGLGDRARGIVDAVVDKDGNWVNPDADHSYDALFGEKSQLRTAYPGNFWHSMTPAEQQKAVLNLAINPATGEYEEIQNLDGYELDGSPLVFTDDKGVNTTLNYYKKKAALANSSDPTKPAAGDDTEGPERKMPYKQTWMREAPLWGSALATGLQLTNYGRPDYRGLDRSLEYASTSGGRAHGHFIGDKLKLQDMDIWAEQNRMNAQANAVNNAIINTSSPIGTKNASLVANNYNTQLGSADAYKKSLEYENEKDVKEAEFNKDTNKYNATTKNDVSKTNAELTSRDIQFKANLAADIAKQKLIADGQWYGGIYGNIGNFFTSLGNIGKENAQHNMIAAAANSGVWGPMGYEMGHATGSYTNLFDRNNRRGTKAARGGKLRRKKGLTF